ncbi:DUF4232 domain-containing protein [Amycolatopsis sp. NBC_01488]|uniref:DUF4232 domain-containing protein n=1 Tax=Amycolatopsis sp. NBC_01488 TaxID=2903563 RepID=UPI003FA45629
MVAVDPSDQSPADRGRVPWRVTSAELGSGPPVSELAVRSPRWQEGARVPPCGSGDLAVSVRWFRAAGGGLCGEVVAENVSGRVCRLGRKPGLQPLGLDGQPLGVGQWVTLELRIPPFVILEPGQLASASISWSGWSGRSASGRIVVSWEGGSATVDAAGPIEPGPPERGSPAVFRRVGLLVFTESIGGGDQVVFCRGSRWSTMDQDCGQCVSGGAPLPE